MASKTTKRHFELFKKEFMKWADFFGLKHIEFHFVHYEIDDAMANCSFSSVGMIATVGFTKTWHDCGRCTNREVRKIAFHECMEAFLFHARNLAVYRFISESEINEEWHRIIRTLENVVFNNHQ